MAQYEITLTSAEDKALSYVAASQDDWIQNVVHHRCAVAIDEVVAITVEQCLNTSMQIPGSKEEMVELAFVQGWVKTAAQRNAEAEAARAAELAARAAEQTQGA